PKESIDSDNSYHYKLDLNDEAGIKFVKSVIELESFSSVKSDCNLKTEDYDKQLEDIKQRAKKDDNMPVIELWVSSKTRRPTKVKVTSDDAYTVMEFVSNIKIGMEDVNIEKPSEFIDIKEIKTQFEQFFY